MISSLRLLGSRVSSGAVALAPLRLQGKSDYCLQKTLPLADTFAQPAGAWPLHSFLFPPSVTRSSRVSEMKISAQPTSLPSPPNITCLVNFAAAAESATALVGI